MEIKVTYKGFSGAVLWEMRPWKNDLSFKLKLCLILVALENPLKEETLELKSSMFAQAPMMFSLP